MSFPLPLISLIWIFLSIHVCFAQIKQPASFFYSPPAGGTNVSLGTSVMVNWTTNWRSSDGGNPWISLAVVQANGAGNWLTQPLLNFVVDPGNFVWEAHSLQSLPIPDNGLHFCLWLGSLQDSADLSKTLYIDSGELSIVAEEVLSSTLSQSMLATSSSSRPGGTRTSSPALSESRAQHPPTSSPTTSGTTQNDGGQLSRTTGIATVAGSIVGAVCAILTAVAAWWGFRKNRQGNRVIPETVRRLHRSVSRRRYGSSVGLFTDGDGGRGRRGN